MKSRLVVMAAAILPFVVVIWAAPLSRREQGAAAVSKPGDSGAFAASREVLERLKGEWAHDHKMLASFEREQSRLRAVVIEKRKLYQDGAIEKAEVSEAERAFVAKLVQIQEARRSLTETDLALAEATMGDELERLPPLAVNEFSETERLSRFNGGSSWSLKEAPTVEKYFSQTFGHHLPISAYGQTATHDRMRFDHRNAVDVALHPDSAEGRALIKHLRGSGIPFVAFKNAVPGAATGPHIHIGKPSVRMAAR
ncbi:MAG TPA: hypothetical protein VJ733_14425 [Candidatus Binatia bacterium]|nr:hypothetical protein [Candidatus Binatia bacterium]